MSYRYLSGCSGLLDCRNKVVYGLLAANYRLPGRYYGLPGANYSMLAANKGEMSRGT
ncbi:hypothetical protein JJE62_04020 [Alloprevotella tannerae]|nr:hypothetical protein [Alloprevotella tannerae]